MGRRHKSPLWKVRVGVLAACLAAGFAFAEADAHPSLEHYLQFNAKSVFHEDLLDTYFDIGFNGERAQAERQAMDADADGSIGAEESADYLLKLESGLPKLLRMRLDGAFLALMPLYDAELDFAEEKLVGAFPFTLRLSFFARVPRLSRPPRQLVADISFFPDTPALLSWNVSREAPGGTALVAQFQEAFPIDVDGPRPRMAAVPLYGAAPAPSMPAGPSRAQTEVPKEGAYAEQIKQEREKLREAQGDDAADEESRGKRDEGARPAPLKPRGKP